MLNKVHGGGAPVQTKRVFLLSGTAEEGKAVCFNWDALTVTAENDSLGGVMATISAADFTDARRVMVEDPDASNKLHFAGIVDKASDGVVGPNWILVHEVGSVCNVYTGAAITCNIGAAAITTLPTAATAKPQILTFNAGGPNTGEYSLAGLPGEGCVMLLAEGAASVPSDTYLKMGKILGGDLPSGGIATHSTALAGSTISIRNLGYHGKSVFSLSILTADTLVQIPSGSFINQRLQLHLTATLTQQVIVSADFSWPLISQGVVFGGGDAAIMSAAADFLDIQWNGVTWSVNCCEGTLT